MLYKKRPWRVGARGNIAVLYKKLGRHGEAREAYVAVLAGKKRMLGGRHPSAMQTQFNLALLLHDELGEREQGLALMREVVAVYFTVRGGA